MIESGQVAPEDVIALVETEPAVWLRLAAARVNGEWQETHMEITGGVAPPRFTTRRWNYDEALFLSFEISGSQMAEWLRQGAVMTDDVTVRLPTVPAGQTVQWYRRSSRQAYGGWETLGWPMTSYQLAGQPLTTGRGSGALIGDGPSFVRFAEAVASFFCFTPGAGGSVDSMSPTFQRQDLAGRITTVRVESVEVSVFLEGDALEGMMVELASTEPGPSQALSGTDNKVVRFPLPGGLPPGAWVALKRGTEWIDRKFINYPNAVNPDPGVEIAVEPTTEVMALVSGGEGATIEFKSVLPPSGSELREKVCRTVAALANGDGGHVLFGVEDNGVVVGVSAVDPQEACDTVARFVSSTVTPVPGFRVDGVPVDLEGGREALVVVLAVEPGSQPPYGVNPANPRYYIRRGATTFPASSDQVRALARSRPPTDDAHGGLWGSLWR
jgi:hypothetical protein